MKFTKKDVIMAVVVIVIGSISFYAGTRMNDKGSATNANNRLRSGGITRGGQGSNGGFVGGEVISKDDTSLTIKLRDGGSKIIFVTPQTPVMKSVAGSAGDVSVGTTIMAGGKTNPDGSIAADSIQIRPAQPPVTR